jgi:hypothetical protein
MGILPILQWQTMRRLNVQFSQIDECISKALFALPNLPATPPLRKGEELLLQLVMQDARRLGKENSRIEFALIFDYAEEDRTGAVSRRHWPNAGRTWRYILHCSDTVPTIPFSLENLGLSRNYSGQLTATYIAPEDEARIRPYMKGGTPARDLWSVASVSELLQTIRNHDQVVRLSPRRATTVREHERRYSDTWLPDTLKRFYNHRCQICVHDFEPRYGTSYADVRVISTHAHAAPLSTDVLVLCPNHNAIIGAASAAFDRRALVFTYPNGLEEPLVLREHLLVA